MHDDVTKILADLPTVHQIANRPLAEQPLLAVVLAQARALAELSGWAQEAARLAAQAAEAEAPDDAAGAAPGHAGNPGKGGGRFSPEQIRAVLKRDPIDAAPAADGGRR